MKHVSVFHTKFGGRKSPAHATVATYIFPDSMPPSLIGMWVDSANILLQSRYRRAKSAPAAVTIDALAFAAEIGTRQTIEPANVIRAMSDADFKRAVDAEMKRRENEKRDAKPAKRRTVKPTAKPTGTETTAPNAEKSGGGEQRE